MPAAARLVPRGRRDAPSNRPVRFSRRRLRSAARGPNRYGANVCSAARAARAAAANVRRLVGRPSAFRFPVAVSLAPVLDRGRARRGTRESVVRAQAHGPDGDDRYRRGDRQRTHPIRHRAGRRYPIAREGGSQRRVNRRLAVTGRMTEEPQVLAVRTGRRARPQRVGGGPERGRREQVAPVPMRRERARLADPPVEHLLVVDAVPAATARARHPRHHRPRVPHPRGLGVPAHLDPLADRPARHRGGVAAHADRAARTPLRPDAAHRPEPTRRRRARPLHLRGRLRDPVRVPRVGQIAGVLLVRFATGEVPAGDSNDPAKPTVPVPPFEEVGTTWSIR